MNDQQARPRDYENRLAALDPRSSICVTAPAGSGKTELLTQRVLRLLACVEQPEDILAITFTRKAAAEMHHRILLALATAASDQAPEQEHRRLSWELAQAALRRNDELGWRLLDNPARLRVQTIDSLCASLTRQMPVLSNFGAQPQITDRAQAYYQLAVRQLFSRLEGSGEVADALAGALRHTDNDFQRLQRLLIDMLQRRDQWLLHLGTGADLSSARGSLEHTLQQIILQALSALQGRLQSYAGDLIPLLDYAGVNMMQQDRGSGVAALAALAGLPAVDIDELSLWQAVTEVLLTKDKKIALRKRLDKNCGFPTETVDGDKALAKQRKQHMQQLLQAMADDQLLLQALENFRLIPAPRFSAQQWSILNELLILLPALVAELTLVFQQAGTVDHTQISLGALQALGDSLNPTELALRLDHRLRHILIDEFQDTSSTQFRLLQRLTEGWSEYNEANPQSPNTVFLVGDGMQSIYGFRNANVGLFLEARRYGINGLKLKDIFLSVNFRSVPEIVEWNNSTFEQAFPASENLSRGAVPYAASVPFNAPDQSADISVLGFCGEDAEGSEARHIADLISHQQQADPEQSIAVLVRSRSHLQSLIVELSGRGIPWQATDIDPLSSYTCIMDLTSLTRAVLNFSDRISWSALLRTPWFGLDNRDLFVLLGDTGEQAVWHTLQRWQLVADQLSKQARDMLSLRVPLLEYAIARRQRLPFRDWLEGLWMSLGGAAALANAEEFEVVECFFDALQQYQVGGSASGLVEFESAMTQLYANPVQEESRLQLMTIHKSKGLEFDTVILPGLGRATRSDDNPLLLWREFLSGEGGDDGLVVAAMPHTGGEDRIYDHLIAERNLAQAMENTRLLYVAATRAIKRLYLTFTSEIDERSEQPRPARKNSLLDCVWQAVAGQIVWQTAPRQPEGQMGLSFEAESAATAEVTLQRLQTRWTAPAWSFPNPLQPWYLAADKPGAERDGDAMRDLPVDSTAVACGVVVHAIFEALRDRGINHWQQLEKRSQSLWVQRLLERHSLGEEQLAQAQSLVFRAVENTLQDGRGRWLLSPSAKTDFCELAVSTALEGGVRHRMIDRVLRDERGQLWIVDYKTGLPAPGESRQQFVARESELYRAQLESYLWYVSQLIPGEASIRLALYFTAIPLLHELDASAPG